MAEKYILHLGGITFDIAPEEKIEFVTGNELAKIDIPGKAPEYQAMGPGEKTCSWNGIFEDATENKALEKAKEVEALSNKGEAVKFIYADIEETVLIRSFKYTYFSVSRVRYDIELVAIAKETGSTATSAVTAENNNSVTVATIGELEPDLSSVTETLDYTVNQGDNLRSIAASCFGSPHEWEVLAQLNDLNGSELPEGFKTITIPKNGEVLAEISSQLEDIIGKLPTLE